MINQLKFRRVVVLLFLLYLIFYIFGYIGIVTEEETIGQQKKDGGIAGSTFYIVSEILIFPFRIIGKTFDFIF